jgi:hypothetical protein
MSTADLLVSRKVIVAVAVPAAALPLSTRAARGP